MIKGFYNVGVDQVGGTVANSTAETELLYVDIPAGIVSNGVIIQVWFRTEVIGDVSNNDGTFRIKTGTNGAETTKLTLTGDRATDALMTDLISPTFETGGTDGTQMLAGGTPMVYVEDTLDWGAAQTISFTVQFDEANAETRAGGIYMMVTGY